ncbi:DnaD domain protein [Streptococcus uberis]|uniref:replication initiator protein A n=1 Tax=Streptococcus uberis TaxID=1349 RepID=UPI0012B6702B|nr:replication initiator protein A [Streptococcus uberis]MTB43330.1 DnaD domain protein [Streptococcus uberis]
MYIDEVKNNQFYQFPQWLLKEPYNVLSDKAKLIYMLLFDRRSLSVQNKWFDDSGKVYMYYTNEQLADVLKCSNKTIVKAKKELQEVNLLQEVRQGVNKPNRLYINGSVVSTLQEVSILPYGSVKTTLQEVSKVHTINTNNINTNISILNNQDLVPSNQTTTNNLYSIAETEFGRLLSPYEIETVGKMIKENNSDLVEEAIKLTRLNGKTNLMYTDGILRNWRDNNITTIEQVRSKNKRKSNSDEVSEYDNIWG